MDRPSNYSLLLPIYIFKLLLIFMNKINLYRIYLYSVSLVENLFFIFNNIYILLNSNDKIICVHFYKNMNV